MKHEITESIALPEGITCEIQGSNVICKAGNLVLERLLEVPQATIAKQAQNLVINCKKGSKKEYKVIKSFIAHLGNMFKGLNTEFVYKLESCNLHFPMTIKLDKNTVVIGNFLGEKVPRVAKVLPTVKVDIKGQKITLSSHNRDLAGQTAANIEKATKIKFRDRRIFQDGIFITQKPGDKE